MFYPKLILSWNNPKRLFPSTAATIRKMATIANNKLTSLRSYGGSNNGFLLDIFIFNVSTLKLIDGIFNDKTLIKYYSIVNSSILY